MRSINIAQPQITESEIRAVSKVLRSGKLTSGEKVKQFEEDFAKYIGTSYALTVANGTVALYLGLIALGIGPGDEVATSPFTFAASVEAILWAGATPVFVDIDPVTFDIDASKITRAITSKTKAILPVHLYGQPADMEKILAIAKKYKLKIIEDCAQAVGAEGKISKSLKLPELLKSLKENEQKKVGSIGDVGCFSFYATKNMTTGEGGMITTNSKEIYNRCLLLRNHGSKKRYHHTILGWNFRLTEIQAILGIMQLKKLDKLNRRRQKNALFLDKHLANIEGLIIPTASGNVTHVYHQYTIRITSKFPLSRDKFVEIMRQKGIGVEVYYPIPLHRQIFLKKYLTKSTFGKLSFPQTEKAAGEVVSLPIHPGLEKSELVRIVSAVKTLTD